MKDFPQLSGFKSHPGFIRVIGHRGARGLMPENTMEGFEFTLGLGVMALEFDVLLSKDNVPVVTHDNYLSRASTRDSMGRWLKEDGPYISELTLSELKEFDVGGLNVKSLYGAHYPEQKFLSGVRIPTLKELLDFAIENRKRVKQQLQKMDETFEEVDFSYTILSCLLYTSPSPRDMRRSRMPSSA